MGTISQPQKVVERSDTNVEVVQKRAWGRLLPASRLVELNGSQLQLRFRIPLIEVLHPTGSILASIAAIVEAPPRRCSATVSCENSTNPTLHRLLASAPKNIDRSIGRNGDYDAGGYCYSGYFLIRCFADVVAYSFPH
jgi:hypothetical protein